MALGPRSATGLCCASRAKRHPGSGPLSSNVRPLGHSAGHALAAAAHGSHAGNGARLEPLAFPRRPPVSQWAARPLHGPFGAFGQHRCCRGSAVQLDSRRRPRLSAPASCWLQSPVPRSATPWGVGALRVRRELYLVHLAGGLTGRWSGTSTGMALGPRSARCHHPLRGRQAPFRFRPLSSNVRPHKERPGPIGSASAYKLGVSINAE